MAVDISDLGLPPDDELPPIDYAAPEPGQFPPQIYPGVYEFKFKLNDDPWDTVEIAENGGAKRKYFQVIHDASTTVRAEDTPHGEPGGDAVEVNLNYQRVNAYKHPKMNNSSLGDFLRAMDIRLQGPLSTQLIANTLKEVSERKQYPAEVGWRAYCKNDEVTISTSPRKKKGDIPWPRDAAGKPVLQVECPKCHQKMYGNAEIIRYKLPTAAEQAPTEAQGQSA